MSKIFKQSLAAIMVVLMILTSAPLGGFIGIDMNSLDFGVSASASTLPESGSCGENVTYTYNSTTKELVISGTGAMTDYGYYLGSTFYNSDIESIVITSGVTTIGEYAFSYCSSLTSVTIPDSVTSIRNYAFRGCTGLSSITIPDSVTTIGYAAFKGCTNLSSITIPDSVTDIRDSAFEGCTGLSSITIPDSETYIGVSVFEGCTGLSSITIPDSVTAIGLYAFAGCTGLSSITIPDSVTDIGESAFEGCTGLSSITIPDSVTSIGWSAFEGCTGLSSITIPDSVTSIGIYAFEGCANLSSITIPDSVTYIGDYAFRGCTGLSSIYVDENNGYYSSDSYGVLFNKDKTKLVRYPIGNSRTSYSIPDSVTTIGDYAFEGCTGLSSITIPDSVTSIGESAFYGCTGFSSIYVDENNGYYSSDSYGVLFNKDKTKLVRYPIGNSRTSYSIPDSVTDIEDYAFEGCTGLSSITIPDSVTSIGYAAFRGCTGLSSITIPDSVTYIGGGAFNGCTNLSSIYVDENNGYYSSDSYGVLFNKDKTKLVSYPIGNSRTSYSIPDSVTDIEDYAFEGCTGLSSITIPDSVTSIGWYAFEGCTNLSSITIPDSVTYIGGSVFKGCTGLSSITIPDSVTYIGGSVFAGCTGLSSITIPDSVTDIGNYAFEGCTGLSDVYYSGTEQQWNQIAIDAYNEYLTNATIHYNHKHSYKTVVTASTCTKEGYTTYTCECGDSYTEKIGIDANAHSWDGGKVTTVATCKVSGVKTYTCQHNASHKKTENLGVNASNHANTKNVAEVKATCTEKGYTAGVFCNDCQKYISGHNEIAIDANAHMWDGGKVTTAATCKVSGVKTYTCQHNASHKKTENLGVNASNHANTKNVAEVKATCTEKGYTAGVFCNDCQKYISGHKEIAIDANAHMWDGGKVTTAATCKVSGVKTYTCQHNASHKKTENLGVNASNHANTKNVAEVKATCTVKGYTAGVFCNDCQKYISGHKEIAINASNHVNTKNVAEVKPTTENVGYTAGVYCNDCKKYISGHSEIPKIAASFTDSENAKKDGNNVLVNQGLSSKELLSQAGKNAVIKDTKGNVLAADKLPGTGMTIILADGKKYVIVVFGDIDGSGTVTAADARLTLRASVGLESYQDGSAQYKAANVGSEDKLSAADARLILRASVGLEDPTSWLK